MPRVPPMTIPAQIADAVTNSRVKIAAGNGDYLDAVVVALAELAMSHRQAVLTQRRVLRKLTEGGMVFTCTHCGFSQSDGPLPDDHWKECEKHPARADLQAAFALLRRWYGDDFETTEEIDRDTAAFLSDHQATNEQPKSEDDDE